MKMQTTSILGVRVARMDARQVLDWIRMMVGEKTPRQIVTANAEIIYKAYREEEFDRLLKTADLVTADGSGVLWASRFIGKPLPERVAGIDLVQQLFALAEQEGWSLYFLGAQQEVVEKAVLNVLSNHNRLRIVGYHHGYFSQEETGRVAANICKVKPDILLVAMGVPRQEQFIRQYKKEMQVPVSIGVGGSFDVLAGVARRAPHWMQKSGLEWLYRLIKEPWRYKRALQLPKFVAAVFQNRRKDKLGSN